VEKGKADENEETRPGWAEIFDKMFQIATIFE